MSNSLPSANTPSSTHSATPAFQRFHLHQVDLAFEHRLLHALPDAFAHLGDPTQSTPAGLRLGVHVVADDDQHGRYLIA